MKQRYYTKHIATILLTEVSKSGEASVEITLADGKVVHERVRAKDKLDISYSASLPVPDYGPPSKTLATWEVLFDILGFELAQPGEGGR